MIQLFSGVATALERHKIRMRSVLDRGATRVESALDREVTHVETALDSHEKLVSFAGAEEPTARRRDESVSIFSQVNGFQANKIKRPRPHATESRRFLPESDVGLAQPSHRSAQACGPWGVMPVAAGHGARARSVMGRWSYRALASPMIPAYRGSRRTCGVAMPVAPQTGGSPVACSISHALAFFVERVLGRTWRGVRLTEGVGSSIGADGVSTMCCACLRRPARWWW